ncbi:MAG TPA: class I adenylate-forming enzyme family protein, partial [Aldersonia sp.]
MSLNLAVLLRSSTQADPTHPVVIDGDRTITYAELDDWSDRVAAGLVRHGVQAGDTVVLQLPNIAEFVACLYGVFKVGAVAIPVNTLNKAPEIAYIMDHADARVLISHNDTAATAVGAIAERPGAFVFLVGTDHAPDGARPFADLVEGDHQTPPPFALREPGDTAVLLYTSGTTGKPKGVKLTHFQLY